MPAVCGIIFLLREEYTGPPDLYSFQGLPRVVPGLFLWGADAAA